jgi:hypothetical protein
MEKVIGSSRLLGINDGPQRQTSKMFRTFRLHTFRMSLYPRQPDTSVRRGRPYNVGGFRCNCLCTPAPNWTE